MPFSGATPACEALPLISTSQFSWPTAPMIRSDGELAVDVDAHHRAAEIGGIELARAVQAALLAHREEQRDRRVRQLVLEERLGERRRARRSRCGCRRRAPSCRPRRCGRPRASAWRRRRAARCRDGSRTAAAVPAACRADRRSGCRFRSARECACCASSKRIAEAGTPAVFSASLTAAAMLASWPVTPSTERNRIR